MTASKAKSKLKQWREAHGYTVQECADLVGLSAPHFTRIENAERSIQKPAARVRFARCLGARVSDLFEPLAPVSEDDAE
jgi:transcriptional regulator with XRE-family HTH domain